MFRKIVYALTVTLSLAGIGAELLRAPVPVVFVLTALAMVGLAWLLSQATESLGHHAGPRVGGILSATFGNAAELIITIFALSAGLTTVVKASIIGSILGNALLVLGMSLVAGGLKNGTQRFSSTIAGANAAMLAIVAVGLSLPTIFAATGPILVFLGPLLGHPLTLVFSPLELGALAATVVVTGFIALDGESNWLEGVMLCGVYLIAALAFYFST